MMMAGAFHRLRRGNAASPRGSAPHFLFRLVEKKMGCGRSKRKGRFFAALRCSGPPRGRGASRAGAGKDCRPSAGSRRTTHLRHPCAACPVRRSSGRKIEWPLLLNPLPLHVPRRTRQRLTAAQPLAALPLTDAACPLRGKRKARRSEDVKCDFAPTASVGIPPRGPAPRALNGSAAPVRRLSQTRRHSLTSSPRMISDLWASAPKVALNIFSFDRGAAICLRLNAAASGGWLRHAPAGAVFLMSQKENGGRIGASRRCGWIPASNGTHRAHPPWKRPPAGAGLRAASVLPLAPVGLPPRRERRVFRGEGGGVQRLPSIRLVIFPSFVCPKPRR